MAYAVKMAAALSGATSGQLRHWRSARTGPLLVPEWGVSPRVLYSFRDVLALRTFVRLRENTSLQRIRAAIGNLRVLGEADHLVAYRLVSDAAGNIQLVTEDEAVSLDKNRGQLQLLVPRASSAAHVIWLSGTDIWPVRSRGSKASRSSAVVWQMRW